MICTACGNEDATLCLDCVEFPQLSPAGGVPVGGFAIEDIDPAQMLSANRRIHHMVRSQVCAYWRDLAARSARTEYGIAEEGESWHQRVRVELWVRFPDRRRHDVGNLYPYVAKPIMDGLVDARIIPDDDDRHLIGPDLRRDPDRGPHRIIVRIEDAA